MPLPTIADTVRAALEWTYPNGHAGANILHFRKSGALTQAAAESVIVTAVTTWLSTIPPGDTAAVRADLHTATRLERIRFTWLDGNSAARTSTINVAGTDASEPLPIQVGLVATLRTALRGRRNRGRFYVGGYGEGANASSGNPFGSVATRLQRATENLRSSLAGSGVSLVVASYGSFNQQTGTFRWTPYATDVTSISVDTRWDTQRRRLRT